jgi:hypothetical protein
MKVILQINLFQHKGTLYQPMPPSHKHHTQNTHNTKYEIWMFWVGDSHMLKACFLFDLHQVRSSTHAFKVSTLWG